MSSSSIVQHLQAAGFEIEDVYELVNTRTPYPDAVPILLESLKRGIDDPKTKEGVVRALAVKESTKEVSDFLIKEYASTPKSNVGLRWAIGNTLYTTAKSDHIDQIVEIVRDGSNGISRQMLVLALGKLKANQAESTLIGLLDDSEVAPHAVEALGRIKSKKALSRIEQLTSSSNKLVAKNAVKAVERIESTR